MFLTKKLAVFCLLGPLTAALMSVCVAHDGIEVNPELGVPGFPDCVQAAPTLSGNVEQDAMTLKCFQRPKSRATQQSIACVGDSITAGAHSTGGNHTYPGQLQILLGDDFVVTNLGACGSTLMKNGNSPYWQRPQFQALIQHKWDIVIIMLGTNDAKDEGDGGPPNWPHNCGGPAALSCEFSKDYASMIDLVRTLGTTPAGPDIYLAIPPPLMLNGVYGMNQTVINKVFPVLVPEINAANKIANKPINVFGGMGGNEQSQFPPGGCTLSTPNAADCKWWCDQQSCDQCHPNNNGYHVMAEIMAAGLGHGR